MEWSDWEPEIEINGTIVNLTVYTSNSAFQAQLADVTFEARVESDKAVVMATVPGPGFDVKAVISTEPYGAGEVLAVSYGAAGEAIRLSWPIRVPALV